MDFKKLMAEIEYYESVGKYKLADELSNKLLKVAREFNVKDIGSGADALVAKSQMQQLEYYVNNIPECALCFQSGRRGEIRVVADLTDQIAQLVASGMPLPAATQKALSNRAEYQDIAKDPAGLGKNCITCYQKIHGVTASKINPLVPSGEPSTPPTGQRITPSSGVPPIK